MSPGASPPQASRRASWWVLKRPIEVDARDAKRGTADGDIVIA